MKKMAGVPLKNNVLTHKQKNKMKTRSNVSILVGSGFSFSEKIPGVGELNKRLSKIDKDEIFIGQDGTAFFLNGQKDPSSAGWKDLSRVEKTFVQEFLEFYNKTVLKPGKCFNYEAFYDYYSGYLRNPETGENKEAIEGFCKEFNERWLNKTDAFNRISFFNEVFNQLLASLLHKGKYYEDAALLDHPPYDAFIAFLRKLLETHDVKFHTLNHDLFFDWLGRNHSGLSEHFTDGYQLEGSPFYGTVHYNFNNGTNKEVHKYYHVKLNRFTDKFDKPLAFYKLHGSIDNEVVYPGMRPEELRNKIHESIDDYKDASAYLIHQKEIRIKGHYGISEIFIETNIDTGEPELKKLMSKNSSDFLSGTTNKMKSYTEDSYYQKLLEHFKNNLLTSELLVVIGYGFKDPGINDYLKEYFLSKCNHMVVIDPVKPEAALLEKYHPTHIQKGITEVTDQEYLEKILSRL